MTAWIQVIRCRQCLLASAPIPEYEGFKALVHIKNCSIAQVTCACEIRRFQKRDPVSFDSNARSNEDQSADTAVATIYASDSLDDFRATIRRSSNHFCQKTKDKHLDAHSD